MSVRVLAASMLLMTVLGAGCATVRPYERELLAQPGMKIGAEETNGLDHVLSYREGAGGETTVQGGGCGCN